MFNKIMRFFGGDDSAIYEPVEPTKEDTINVLAGKEMLLGNYVNWLNQRQGLPMMTIKEGQSAQPGTVMHQYTRLERYAREQGWV